MSTPSGVNGPDALQVAIRALTPADLGAVTRLIDGSGAPVDGIECAGRYVVPPCRARPPLCESAA